MANYYIFHYEDEPDRVDLPWLLEIANYSDPRVVDSSIEKTVDLYDYSICYRIDGEEFVVRYLIAETIAALEAKSGLRVEDVDLHLVDMNIDPNHKAGIEIASELIARNVSNENIWVVTAYEDNARLDQRLSGIAIYPKPSPLSKMVDQILLRILAKK